MNETKTSESDRLNLDNDTVILESDNTDLNNHDSHDSDQLIYIFSKNDLEKIIEMKEEQYYYVDNDLHDLMIWKFVKDDESNVLKSDKTNWILIDLFDVSDITNIDEIIFWQNSEVSSDTINENVSISFEIQIHQNVNLNLIDQVVARYSVVWSKIRQVVNILEKYWIKIHLKNN